MDEPSGSKVNQAAPDNGAEDLPFTTFRGRLKQIDAALLPETFDLFYPKFRTEEEWRSQRTDLKGAISSDTSSFLGRGRERRFAGDRSLPRGRYYCLMESDSNKSTNNTLLGELFAYADPKLPVVAELLDSLVDAEKMSIIEDELNWSAEEPYLMNIIKINSESEDPWLFPWVFAPVFGFDDLNLFRYPVKITEVSLDNVIDLRLPETLDWMVKTFGELEANTDREKMEGKTDDKLVMVKGRPPDTLPGFMPLLLSQQLGGGSLFIQGIGAWLRSRGANAIIYPAARSDSRTVVRNGAVVESFGYIFLDYRGANLPEFDKEKFFGMLPSWRERVTASFAIEEVRRPDEFRLEIGGVRRLQEYRFVMFHDWTRKTLRRVQTVLHTGEQHLSDYVKPVVRKPIEVLGPEAKDVLGPALTFVIEEGGGSMGLSGFLAGWRGLNNAEFLAEVLPVARSDDWEPLWRWDELNWFLHRKCLRRPWAVLKCPVCLFEQFWNVTRGKPEESCVRCKFQGKKDGIHVNEWFEWANTLPIFKGSEIGGESSDLVKENNAIYSSVCWCCRDAVTGKQPATQEEAVMQTR